jgi:hypothetical protein
LSRLPALREFDCQAQLADFVERHCNRQVVLLERYPAFQQQWRHFEFNLINHFPLPFFIGFY